MSQEPAQADKLTRYQRSILALVEAAGEKGLCLSKAELAARCGCCVRTADHAMRKLRELGLVLAEPCFDAQSGGQTANVYRLP